MSDKITEKEMNEEVLIQITAMEKFHKRRRRKMTIDEIESPVKE